jgi:transcriptional regulator with XRE-family HTH domain
METMFTRIKNKRLELKMSQEDLAAKVGYSDKSAISHLEKVN